MAGRFRILSLLKKGSRESTIFFFLLKRNIAYYKVILMFKSLLRVQNSLHVIVRNEIPRCQCNSCESVIARSFSDEAISLKKLGTGSAIQTYDYKMRLLHFIHNDSSVPRKLLYVLINKHFTKSSLAI